VNSPGCALATVAALATILGLCAGCSSESSEVAPTPHLDELPAGVAARVGDQQVPTALVQRVASAQKISPQAARERLIQTALLALHAERSLGPVAVVAAERAALSRAVLERLLAQARAGGEPTDDELGQIIASRWLELDRPPAVKTSHAVVLLGEAADRGLARRIADRIAGAVRGVSDGGEFRRLASAVPSDGARVRVEQLPAVTADGRVVPEQPQDSAVAQRLDPAFARAANAIAEVGAQSGVVESAHGFHVILLEERLAERRVPLEESRSLLRDEAVAMRARSLEAELLSRLSRDKRVEISRSAQALTAEIQVRP
jgi:hypothetical protein